MAKVKLKELRELEAGYHIYRQPSPAGEMIIVRRKVATPTDVEHRSSKATQAQRQRFARASKKWASLPPVVRADLRQNYGIVDVQTPHGLSTIDVLQGSHLFISQEIHQQKYHQEHVQVPMWLCVQTVDPKGRVIDVPLSLWNYYVPGCRPAPAYYISPGNTFFYPVPESDQLYDTGQNRFGLLWRGGNHWYLDQLKAGVRQIWCPHIREDGAGPYSRPTNPTEENWYYFTAATPQNLAITEVHEHDGSGFYNFFPWPMARFTVDLIDDRHVKVTIDPLLFYWDNVFSWGLGGTPPLYWTVHVTAPGQWTLDPPQKTMIFDYIDKVVTGYQD